MSRERHGGSRPSSGEKVYATHVSFCFDGQLLKTITGTSVIPTDPIRFVLGPRLVTFSAPLTSDFTETVTQAEITP